MSATSSGRVADMLDRDQATWTPEDMAAFAAEWNRFVADWRNRIAPIIAGLMRTVAAHLEQLAEQLAPSGHPPPP